MSETQFIAIMVGFAATVIASIVTTLTALLINNARSTDAKEALRSEIQSVEARLDSKLGTGISGVLSQMATYQLDIISKIAELDNRITRLER
jgi:hypothetical protein